MGFEPTAPVARHSAFRERPVQPLLHLSSKTILADIIRHVANWYNGWVPEQYKRKPNAVCLICNKSIYRRPIELERSKNRAFCTVVCYGIACRKERPCVVCGTLILATKNAKTCSRACANTNRKGIKYKLGRPKRDKVKTQRFLKIRLIHQRGTMCERCKYPKIEILQVHHKDRNRKNNELDNLELICPNCHAEEHYLKNSWLSDMVKA